MVRVELNENMSVPRGTRGELVEALMGGVTMNLLLGPNPTDHIAPFDTISGAAAGTLMGDAGKMMPDVQRMLPKLDSILTNLNRLSGDPALQKTLTNAAAISENLKTTTAQLDRLMARDVPQLMAHLNRTGANAERLSGNLAKVDVQQTMDRVNATLTSAQQLSGQLNTVVGDLNQKLNSRDNNLGAFLSDRELYERRFATHRLEVPSETVCALLYFRPQGQLIFKTATTSEAGVVAVLFFGNEKGDLAHWVSTKWEEMVLCRVSFVAACPTSMAAPEVKCTASAERRHITQGEKVPRARQNKISREKNADLFGCSNESAYFCIVFERAS